jgi:hypothetical protein
MALASEDRVAESFLYALGVVALVLSPLIYSVDGDPFRSYEVMAVAALSSVLLFAGRVGNLRKGNVILVLTYALIAVLQQMVINSGSLGFGIQYACVMTWMFIPTWGIEAAYHRMRNFTASVASAIDILFLIVVISIYISFFFGIGEVRGGDETTRAFAWLGDSITPVIVFLIIFFALEMQWIRVAALLIALYMTGGKMATLMLGSALVIYALTSGLKFSTRCLLAVLVALPLLVTYFYWGWLLSEVLPTFAYSYHNRFLSYAVGLQYFLENPWFGTGINQSMRGIEQEAELAASAVGVTEFHPIYQIHNAFIRTAAETGIAGLSILLALCGLLFIRSARAIVATRPAPRSRQRSLIIAGSLWTMTFVLVYQSTGWFEAGHPQLAWLLMIATISHVAYRQIVHARRTGIHRISDIAATARVPVPPPQAVARLRRA